MRCPHCGKNNYGDVTKCFSCGQDMKTASGQAVIARPTPAKSKAVKRIRMPVLIIIGAIIFVIGIMATILPYFVFTASPNDFERDDNGYFAEYKVGETPEVRGEVTYKLKCTLGYIYELGGDGKFKDASGTDLTGDRSYSTYSIKSMDDKDMTFWSFEDVGAEGDTLFIEVIVSTDPAEVYQWLEKNNNEPWMWKYFVWGIFFFIVGGIIALIGFIGKKDKSMETYLESHPELKKGDIALSEYQKQQAEQEKQRILQSRQVNYSNPPTPMATGQQPAASQPMAAPPQKPTSGICRQCGQPTLTFNDDGTGQCMNCNRPFVWDPSRAPAPSPQQPSPQAAPAQPLSFEPPK